MICRPEEEEDTAGAGAVDFKRKEVFDMPGFSGTGPAGMGPMTGRGQGLCNPSGSAYGSGSGMGMVGGRSFGRGRGTGRGMGLNSRRGFSGQGARFSGRGSGAGRGKGGRR